jgi:hypothetical protein
LEDAKEDITVSANQSPASASCWGDEVDGIFAPFIFIDGCDLVFEATGKSDLK